MKTRLSETLRERAWSSPVWIVQGRRAFNIAKVNVNSTEMQGTRLCQKQLKIMNWLVPNHLTIPPKHELASSISVFLIGRSDRT